MTSQTTQPESTDLSISGRFSANKDDAPRPTEVLFCGCKVEEG